MVRLILIRTLSSLTVQAFQFHYGTIDTRFPPDKEAKFLVSIPLWYDWYSFSWFSYTLFLSFNSTMVRLIPLSDTPLSPPEIGFNSTMVRLILDGSRRSTSSNWVSIPLWYDWYRQRHLRLLPVLLVSIPLWYDWYITRFSTRPTGSPFQFHYGTIDTIDAETS